MSASRIGRNDGSWRDPALKNARIGVIAGLKVRGDSLRYVADFGLQTCQLVCWEPEIYSASLAGRVKKESAKSGVRITSLWAGWPGPANWNFTDGPATLGLVPREWRDRRVTALRKAGDFAARAGIPAVVTHLGFIPENQRERLFGEMVAAVRGLARYFGERGLEFWFETGQETPVTLLRLIETVGLPNLGINLDPANLIMYGKANPIDALEVFGKHVKSVHAKDGLYPTDPMKLGEEVRVGKGKVRFPEFVRALEGRGYRGAYIIEREIEGAKQSADIAATVDYLSGFLGMD